jgi:hypothetical protein
MIESFAETAGEELRDWVSLSLKESKMHLEGELLGENQILISTGLGGRNNKLRYFVVLIARNRDILNGIQKKIIESEFSYVIEESGGEIEEIEFSEYLSAVTLLLPIYLPVKHVFDKAIRECNFYGDFLRDNFIVTNVKTIPFDEIKTFIERKHD